jgi:hypothetical protein
MPRTEVISKSSCESLFFNKINMAQVGHAVVQLVQALLYKPEGCGFDSQWASLEFYIDIILLAALCPWG